MDERVTLREYLRSQRWDYPTFIVSNLQEFELCRQVWDIALDELRIWWDGEGWLYEITLHADLSCPVKFVTLTLNGRVDESFCIKPSERWLSKFAWVNGDAVVFGPIMVQDKETMIQVWFKHNQHNPGKI